MANRVQIYAIQMRVAQNNIVLVGFIGRSAAESICGKIVKNTEALLEAASTLKKQQSQNQESYMRLMTSVVNTHVANEDRIRENPAYKKDPMNPKYLQRGKSRRRENDLLYKDPVLLNTVVIVNNTPVDSVFYVLSKLIY